MNFKLQFIALLVLGPAFIFAETRRDLAQQLAVEATSSGVSVSLNLRAGELTPSGRVKVLNTQSLVNLSNASKLKIGSFVVICLNATAAGFVTVWVKASDQGHSTLILPNAYSGRKRAQHVEANREICVGDQYADFRFRIAKPIGQYQLLAHWTAQLDDAIAEDAYADLSRSASYSLEEPGVTQRLNYEVTE